jgi:hypothetical protein
MGRLFSKMRGNVYKEKTDIAVGEALGVVPELERVNCSAEVYPSTLYRKMKVACRNEKASSPEKTSQADRPSGLIHFDGKSPCSPGPTSHVRVK